MHFRLEFRIAGWTKFTIPHNFARSIRIFGSYTLIWLKGPCVNGQVLCIRGLSAFGFYFDCLLYTPNPLILSQLPTHMKLSYSETGYPGGARVLVTD